MPVSNSRLSYSDCFTLFDKALESKKGARYQVNNGVNHGDSWQFRLRMHQARAIDRKDNRELYSLGDPLYGHSVYDPLIIQIKVDTEGKYWIYVKHTEIDVTEIEDLDDVEAEEQLEAGE